MRWGIARLSDIKRARSWAFADVFGVGETFGAEDLTRCQEQVARARKMLANAETRLLEVQKGLAEQRTAVYPLKPKQT
jgi:hypothetical protein